MTGWRAVRKADAKKKTALILVHLSCKQPLSLGERGEPLGREREREMEKDNNIALHEEDREGDRGI